MGALAGFLMIVLFLGTGWGGVQAVYAAPYGIGGSESTFDPTLMQIDETKHLGAPLEKGATFIDGTGNEFTLGEMLGKPLILLFSYYGCDGSCPIINQNLKQALAKVDRFKIGEDYRVVTVSFDKQDGTEAIGAFVEKLDIPVELRKGWKHAVLKDRESSVENFARSVGYRFFWSKADQVFVHPNAVVFLTPEGRIARYLYGTSLDDREIEVALIDADWNRISNSSNVIDMLTGVCYSYNYAEGKYTINYSLFIGVASLLFGLSLIIFSAIGFHRKRARGLSHV